MSDQASRNPQHSDPQKPSLVQKPGNQPKPPAQEKQEFPSGQPKRTQSEQEKHDALAVVIRGWLVRQIVNCGLQAHVVTNEAQLPEPVHEKEGVPYDPKADLLGSLGNRASFNKGGGSRWSMNEHHAR